MIFVRTCSGNETPGIRANLVGIEIPVTSVGNIHLVVSELFGFGFKVTEVDCV